MDLDAFSDARRAHWDRLEQLAGQHRLSGAEADELVLRYQQGARDLSLIQTQAGSTLAGERLSVVLSRARLRLTGKEVGAIGALPRFVLYEFPAALYRIRWLTLACALATVLVAALYAVWALSDPRVLANYGDPALRAQLADSAFVDYYSENPAASFTGLVWTNNAMIAVLCIGLGITGVYVPFVLFQNAMNLGVTGAIMISEGHTDTFLLYIAPHGQLELTAVFVAAAAGLRIFWAWVAPGQRSRARAVAEDAREFFAVAIGLVPVLLVAGIIEGFVTPQPWPWAVKIGIGSLALGALLLTMLWQGRRASRALETAAVQSGQSRPAAFRAR